MENEINILLVEDEALIAHNIKMQLEDFGYNIIDVCYKYETAVEAIMLNNFDLLITDINLGDDTDNKSGFTLVEQLRKNKDCPVIFLTAFSDKATIKNAATYKPSAYLVKPINEANLYSAIQLAVENFGKHNSVTIEENIEEPDYFFVKQGNNMHKIFWNDIFHMNAVKNYVKIRTTQNRTGFLYRSSLQDILKNMLPKVFKNSFIKINRAEAIHKSIIIKVGDGFIETNYGNFSTTKDFKIDDF